MSKLLYHYLFSSIGYIWFNCLPEIPLASDEAHIPEGMGLSAELKL